MNEEAALVRHLVVEGFVQGVGYREFARRSALQLNISGWVRNRGDGSVEALARGGAADVEAFLAELRKGPRGAWVASLRVVEPGENEIEAKGVFRVRETV
jgi:acylphosphatase